MAVSFHSLFNFKQIIFFWFSKFFKLLYDFVKNIWYPNNLDLFIIELTVFRLNQILLKLEICPRKKMNTIKWTLQKLADVIFIIWQNLWQSQFFGWWDFCGLKRAQPPLHSNVNHSFIYPHFKFSPPKSEGIWYDM